MFNYLLISLLEQYLATVNNIMQYQNIHFIINPASGKEEAILSYINNEFKDIDVYWNVSVTTPKHPAAIIARELIGKTDLIVVYGGDGTIAEVAGILYGKQIPVAIIPGGTANVMSKELGIPQDSIDAIRLIASGKTKALGIDIGLANNTPFILRINLGILADMVVQAGRDLKNSYGQLAYGITAVQTLSNSAAIPFRMVIDGVEINEQGEALTVTNAGNIGIGDYKFLPDITVTDGYFDVILMNTTDLISLLRVAGSTLLQTESGVLKHWRCKQISIFMDKPYQYICDDNQQEAQTIEIKILPETFKVLVPAN
jgi:YegS/Rv2252/BmrU family lipid kinase